MRLIHTLTSAAPRPQVASDTSRSDPRTYVRHALGEIPALLELVDRNRFSPTYGSFDRSYWHFRVSDFPCGMSQEYVLALALVYKYPFPENSWFGRERLRELAIAGIEFALRSSHRDGTCDDYFPFERAMGAMTFSLYAFLETYRLLELNEPRFLEFFCRRADWLVRHNESGRLANHQALAALCLALTAAATGEAKYRRAAEKRRDLVLSWQSSEGWFQEYEGADPGYHTFTIDYLAKYRAATGDNSVAEPLRRAVEFAADFLHPDGSYGGEYGSRNTYHFYPDGFELLAPEMPLAGQIADGFLTGMARGKRGYLDDDRLFCHYVINYLQAYLDHDPDCRRPQEKPDGDGFNERWFPQAKMVVCRTPEYHAVANLSKGGVIKVFDARGCIASDTGPIARTQDGRVLVTHLIDPAHRIERHGEGDYEVSGVFARRRSNLSTPIRHILLRMFMLTIGRWSPNLVRSLLQRILITGKTQTSVRFRRRLRFAPSGIRVEDEITLPEGMQIADLAFASDATSIYVANSNAYQESVLTPWVDLRDRLEELNRSRKIVIQRHFTPNGPVDNGRAQT
ncbi:MAG: hypothetical protein N3D11_08930 [Candidatus Sumerlaeia bacterium]|nr:hypothetical protein [Candidatus Sumerlaeia bacterium]